MIAISDTNRVAVLYGPYVEELHDFFATHGMHFGSPEDLFLLSRGLDQPGAFPNELSSMVRSVLLREGGHMPRTELLMLVAVSIGGPRITESAQDIQEPMSHLMDFLTGVIRNPRNEPAWAKLLEQSSRPARETPGADLTLTNSAAPRTEVFADPPPPPSADLSPGEQLGADQQIHGDLNQPDHTVRSVYSRFSDPFPVEATQPDAANEVHDVPRHSAESSAQRIPSRSRTPPSAGRVGWRPVSVALSVVLLAAAGLFAWYNIAPRNTNSPAEISQQGQTQLYARPPAGSSQVVAAPQQPTPYAQIVRNAAATPTGQTAQTPKPTAALPATTYPGSQTLTPPSVPASPLPAASNLALAGRTAVEKSPPNSQTGDREASPPPTGETTISVHSRASGAAPQRWMNVSSGVMAGNLISAPPPEYPRLASFAHIQGPVLMQAVISKSGTVENLHVIRGHRLLRGAAISAVRKWRYRPYFVNGHAVEVATIVSVDFTLHR